MRALLVQRADELMGCTENSPEERELDALTDVIEAYEALGYRQSLFRRRQRVNPAVVQPVGGFRFRPPWRP